MPPDIIEQLQAIAHREHAPLEDVVKDVVKEAILSFLERWQNEHDSKEERKPAMSMTKAQAAKLAKRLESVSGLRVTGTRTYDGGKSYCLNAVDTVTGYPFVISDPDYIRHRAEAAEDHAALQDHYEAEGQRIKAEESYD